MIQQMKEVSEYGEQLSCSSLESPNTPRPRSSLFADLLHLLEDLANLPETEVAFRAFGLAGKCIVYSLMGEREQALEQFGLLTPTMIDGLEPQMRRDLNSVMSDNRAAMSRESARKLEQLTAGLEGS